MVDVGVKDLYRPWFEEITKPSQTNRRRAEITSCLSHYISMDHRKTHLDDFLLSLYKARLLKTGSGGSFVTNLLTRAGRNVFVFLETQRKDLPLEIQSVWMLLVTSVLVEFLKMNTYDDYISTYTSRGGKKKQATRETIAGVAAIRDSSGYLNFGVSEEEIAGRDKAVEMSRPLTKEEWSERNPTTHTIHRGPAHFDPVSLYKYFHCLTDDGHERTPSPFAMFMECLNTLTNAFMEYNPTIRQSKFATMEFAWLMLLNIGLNEWLPWPNHPVVVKDSRHRILKRLFFDVDLKDGIGYSIQIDIKSFISDPENMKCIRKTLQSTIPKLLAKPLTTALTRDNDQSRVKKMFKCVVTRRISSGKLHIIFPGIIMLNKMGRSEWYPLVAKTVATIIGNIWKSRFPYESPFTIDTEAFNRGTLRTVLAPSPDWLDKQLVTRLYELTKFYPTLIDEIANHILRTDVIHIPTEPKLRTDLIKHSSIYYNPMPDYDNNPTWLELNNILLIDEYIVRNGNDPKQCFVSLEEREKMDAQRSAMLERQEAMELEHAMMVNESQSTEGNSDPFAEEFTVNRPGVKVGITDIEILTELDSVIMNTMTKIPGSKSDLEAPLCQVFNKYFCFICQTSSIIYRQYDSDEKPVFMEVASTTFKETFMPSLVYRIQVPIFDKKGNATNKTKPVDVNLRSLWTQCRQRNTRNRYFFKPTWLEGTFDKPWYNGTDLNRFVGFTWSDKQLELAFAKPAARCHAAKIFAHILNVLCDSDVDKFHWLICLLSKKLIDPSFRSPSSVIFFGPEGVGKSYLFERVLAPYVGAEYLQILHSVDRATSPYNIFFQTCLFMYFDEAPHTRMKKHESFIKNLITAKRMQLEAKYKDIINPNVYMQVFFATNDEVTGYYGPNARRFLPYKVTSMHIKSRNPLAYEKYWEELNMATNEDALKAFFYILKIGMRPNQPRSSPDYALSTVANVDKYGNFGDQTFPDAVHNAVMQQKLYSLSLVSKFWIHCLERGYVYPLIEDWAINSVAVTEQQTTFNELAMSSVPRTNVNKETETADILEAPSGVIFYEPVSKDRDAAAVSRTRSLRQRARIDYNGGRLEPLLRLLADKRFTEHDTANLSSSSTIRKLKVHLSREREPKSMTKQEWLECLNMEQVYEEFKIFASNPSRGPVKDRDTSYKSFLLQTQNAFTPLFKPYTVFEAHRPSDKAIQMSRARRSEYMWYNNYRRGCDGDEPDSNKRESMLLFRSNQELHMSKSPVICWLVKKDELEQELKASLSWDCGPLNLVNPINVQEHNDFSDKLSEILTPGEGILYNFTVNKVLDW